METQPTGGRGAGGMGRPPWWTWRHVVKLDPDRNLTDAELEQVLRCGTDALVVGGTQGITAEKVGTLLARVADRGLPVVLEVSAAAAALPGAAGYLIPLLLNAPDSRWLVGLQAEALGRLVPQYGDLIPWGAMWPAWYVVMNPASAAARLTGARPVPAPDVAGYAALVGRLLRQGLLYIEYSGTFGDPDLVAAARTAAGAGCRTWYGGGIATAAQAEAMAAVAHTVVVGNLVYERPAALAETALAVRRVPAPGEA